MGNTEFLLSRYPLGELTESAQQLQLKGPRYGRVVKIGLLSPHRGPLNDTHRFIDVCYIYIHARGKKTVNCVNN